MSDSFLDFGFPAELDEKILANSAIKSPRPVQLAVIPLVMEGKDVLANSGTGTGKTYAFAMPIVAGLMDNPEAGAMVIVSTRELAVQVRREFLKLIPGSAIGTALLIGGMPTEGERSARILIGTLGRIMSDAVEYPRFNLKKTRILVLDEADKFLMEPASDDFLGAIVRSLPRDRQTLMFSATVTPAVERAAAMYLNNPERVDLGTEAGSQIEHIVVRVKRASERLDSLKGTLQTLSGSAVVFTNKREVSADLAETITSWGIPARALHAGMTQRSRIATVDSLRSGASRVLVATDVAARGLDIDTVDCVVNFDTPIATNDYPHRVGRAGRGGQKSSAVTFVFPNEENRWKAICDRMRIPYFPPEGQAVGASVDGRRVSVRPAPVVEFRGIIPRLRVQHRPL